MPPAASEGRSWLHSGLQQTARGRVYEFTPQSLNANPLRIPAPSTLLLSILRRMRQLALMLENLAQIAAIDPATAGRASHEAIRLCHLGRLSNLRFDRPAENVVAFYNKRGTCEQWIKQGKGAIKWTRLSCRSFAANAVRLQLHALAYNLGNFLRTLATPEPIKDWSLTSLKEKLIKIGAKLVSHGRYVAFQMAEVTIKECCSPRYCG